MPSLPSRPTGSSVSRFLGRSKSPPTSPYQSNASLPMVHDTDWAETTNNHSNNNNNNPSDGRSGGRNGGDILAEGGRKSSTGEEMHEENVITPSLGNEPITAGVDVPHPPRANSDGMLLSAPTVSGGSGSSSIGGKSPAPTAASIKSATSSGTTASSSKSTGGGGGGILGSGTGIGQGTGGSDSGGSGSARTKGSGGLIDGVKSRFSLISSAASGLAGVTTGGGGSVGRSGSGSNTPTHGNGGGGGHHHSNSGGENSHHYHRPHLHHHSTGNLKGLEGGNGGGGGKSKGKDHEGMSGQGIPTRLMKRGRTSDQVETMGGLGLNLGGGSGNGNGNGNGGGGTEITEEPVRERESGNGWANGKRGNEENENEEDEDDEVERTTFIDPTASLRSYSLLQALTASDMPKVQTALSNTTWTEFHSGGRGVPTPLIVAVRCSKFNTIELVLRTQPPSLINYQDSRGWTALHVACALARPDVISLLLAQPQIDDSIKDNEGKTCLEVCSGPEVAKLIQVSRAQLYETFTQLVQSYINSPEGPSQVPSNSVSHHEPHISGLASPPRQSSSGAGGTTTTTTSGKESSLISSADHLHNVKRGLSLPANPTNDLIMAGKSVSNLEAETLYRFIDRPRGKGIDFSMLVEKKGAGQHSGTTLLHEASRRRDLALIKLAISKNADVLVRDKKGKLAIDIAKDERVKSVLRQAATSEGRALKRAGVGSSLTVPTHPNLGVGMSPPPTIKGYLHKWVNMARGWKMRWFVLENGALAYYRSQDDEGRASRGVINMAVARVRAHQDTMQFEVSSTVGKYPKYFLKGNHPVEVLRWIEVIRQNIEYQKATGASSVNYSRSPSNNSAHLKDDDYSGGRKVARDQGSLHSTPPATAEERDRDDEEVGSVLGDDDTMNGDESSLPPQEASFRLLGNTMKTQLELMDQLLAALQLAEKEKDGSVKSGRDGHLTADGASASSDLSNKQAEIQQALKKSLITLDGMMDGYFSVVEERERWFHRRWEREADAKRIWEENMKEAAAQQAEMEIELKKISQDASRRKKVLRTLRASVAASATPSIIGIEEDNPEDSLTAPTLEPTNSLQSPDRHLMTPDAAHRRDRSVSAASRRRGASVSRVIAPHEIPKVLDEEIGSSDESEDEDDFFDAMDSGSMNVRIDTPIASPISELPEWANISIPDGLHVYENLRTSLPITTDNRPPVSLWAILKGSIGKDLTKISFPVYFNEPTSMLQRMAEDMEFSECLDAAASQQDSTLRIAYVAAFAMSNYSSTIGRIAKPFNPMLSETFEYVRLDRTYRYISEQVSHHPPISACISESPQWQYYGEVDAKSKFLGKSFEIRPTGIAHCNLRLPPEWEPTYPVSKSVGVRAVEHYSWKKVTTSVSNFIMGSPQIDHYGDMEITNHRNGERCVLTFKPRGWRGRDAFEIKGNVYDKDGKIVWDIAGRWNSQLIARKHTEGLDAPLNPDDAVSNMEGILLWKNSEKPAGSPFNLTPYAITLNGIDETLKSWLPPTDCRLRPDQHAFENGEFERANVLKGDLEEHQRDTRRKRERGELPEHRPRWFRRERDPDTGEAYWQWSRTPEGKTEYWEERERVGKARGVGENIEWKDVEPIFGDFQSGIEV